MNLLNFKNFRIEITKVGKDHKAVMVEDSKGDYCYVSDADKAIKDLEWQLEHSQSSNNDDRQRLYDYRDTIDKLEKKLKQKTKLYKQKLKEKTTLYKIIHYFKK